MVEVAFVVQHVASSVDWAEMTAIATAALAFGLVFTVAGVVVTSKAAKSDLIATRDAAQAQIEASRRPLLIDVTPTAPAPKDLDDEGSAELVFPGGHETTIKTRRIYVAFENGRAFFAVPLRNVGRGLAVIDSSNVGVSGESLAKQALGCEVQRERIPPGEMTRVLCTYEQASGDKEPNRADFVMTVPYKDLDESQVFAAAVRVVREPEDQWRVRAVKQTAPGVVASQTASYGQVARGKPL